ncbi:uncharacterized protein [Triticum aestivum]|uniref:uncharacterized protein isoform X5 n=1 Tax=Triticum aestivum TaxID=4565 RepID=UPI001ABCE5F7|nr:uncharacterized protein LOC109782164 isoform X5 [Aegilops tauschii subsp. strangulata]XP_044353324.1 uncharacterized protein LOC123074588 isoform X5 [Triticum aestivum]
MGEGTGGRGDPADVSCTRGDPPCSRLAFQWVVPASPPPSPQVTAAVAPASLLQSVTLCYDAHILKSGKRPWFKSFLVSSYNWVLMDATNACNINKHI